MSENVNSYKFKVALFDNSDPQDFLLLVIILQITIEASGTLTDGAKIQYLCMLVQVKALRPIGTFSSEVVITTT